MNVENLKKEFKALRKVYEQTIQKIYLGKGNKDDVKKADRTLFKLTEIQKKLRSVGEDGEN